MAMQGTPFRIENLLIQLLQNLRSIDKPNLVSCISYNDAISGSEKQYIYKFKWFVMNPTNKSCCWFN